MIVPIRVPIAISAVSDKQLVAICNDGSIWGLLDWCEGWKRLPDIPQIQTFEEKNGITQKETVDFLIRNGEEEAK